MKRRHEMPFGAEYRGDRQVRFRLWAPQAREVDLWLSADSRHLPLGPHDGGFFELVTDGIKPGAHYQFQIDGGRCVPDPASRFQPQDVHGPSEVVDPNAFEWNDETWCGRPWEEAVIYELHVGAFTPSGTFAAICERLDDLADLGVTALELMPVADFPGKRNWGYDGVFSFAPDSTYGRPDDLKNLIQQAHSRNLMVLLDVVYNHFGPEGNYLGLYAPQFFTSRHHTPWGTAINFDGAFSRSVRDFVIHNALYWLTEYHFDGLRLDAVDAIVDDSSPHILTELAETVRHSVEPGRYVHLILENDRNQASLLRRGKGCEPLQYTAQWNDDIHHALHVLLTGEQDGYYSDYAQNPISHLGRCLTSGFAYQGEASLYRKGQSRGEVSRDLPPSAFISFLQNHDQVGNRAFGERLSTIVDPQILRTVIPILLLAPSAPLLFMGEEFGARSPFLFFCDFEKEVAAAVTAGRRNEFVRFDRFNDPVSRERIPDPSAVSTFRASHLDWRAASEPDGKQWFLLYKKIVCLRHKCIHPHLLSGCAVKARYQVIGDSAFVAEWSFKDGAHLTLQANLGRLPVHLQPIFAPTIYTSENIDKTGQDSVVLPGWSVMWRLEA